jgi:hypothetical protein
MQSEKSILLLKYLAVIVKMSCANEETHRPTLTEMSYESLLTFMAYQW